jgi:hypothetical protein
MGEGHGRNIHQPGPANETGHKVRQGRIALVAGHLEMDSAPGKGAFIIIRLPLPAGSWQATGDSGHSLT